MAAATELRDIEIFLTPAEELHFGRTAQRLRVTPARVSQAIKKRERRVGAPLFDRSPHHVALTPIGRQLHADLQTAFEQTAQDATNPRAESTVSTAASR